MTTFSSSREIPATVEKVFATFSQPERLSRWWGPAGFTNTFNVCEFKNGGCWSYTMHGPDGKDYPNESMFAEIESLRKVVIEHVSKPKYRLTITLTPSPKGTAVSWLQEFENSKFAGTMKQFLLTANEQNLDRLSAEVEKMAKNKSVSRSALKQCGLCGKTKNLTETDCCQNLICDDEQNYALFSYARNSCHRNHRHYTLCAHHHNEDPKGDWKNCGECRRSFETEMYVWYGTNHYNFEKLQNPPSYEPTRCAGCGVVIKLGTDGYSERGDKYWCQRCTTKVMGRRLRSRR